MITVVSVAAVTTHGAAAQTVPTHRARIRPSRPVWFVVASMVRSLVSEIRLASGFLFGLVAGQKLRPQYCS
jgi:hypothetical protein